MNMRTFLTFAALIFTVSLSAQSVTTEQQPELKGIRKRLGEEVVRDSVVVRGAVTITEHDDAATIVNANINSAPRTFEGYRIVIFASNTQTARRDALAAQKTFAGLRTGEHSYLSYQNPYFKVSVGNFLTHEDALIMLNRIQETFPNAYIRQDKINIREFAK